MRKRDGHLLRAEYVVQALTVETLSMKPGVPASCPNTFAKVPNTMAKHGQEAPVRTGMQARAQQGSCSFGTQARPVKRALQLLVPLRPPAMVTNAGQPGPGGTGTAC